MDIYSTHIWTYPAVGLSHFIFHFPYNALQEAFDIFGHFVIIPLAAGDLSCFQRVDFFSGRHTERE
jgi:hypothetical protein